MEEVRSTIDRLGIIKTIRKNNFLIVFIDFIREFKYNYLNILKKEG